MLSASISTASNVRSFDDRWLSVFANA